MIGQQGAVREMAIALSKPKLAEITPIEPTMDDGSA